MADGDRVPSNPGSDDTAAGDADGREAAPPDADDDGDSRRARPDPGGHVRVVHRDGSARAPRAVRAADLRAEAHRPWLNLPNFLTFFRILLVPAIVVLVVIDTPTARWWAFGVFVFAAATDTVDGWVARRWHGVTRWGQIADPVADKLLVIGTLTILAVLGALPWWAVIVIVVREIAVTLLRVRLVHHLDLVMPATAWGKVKTLSQLVAVGVFLLPGVSLSLRLGLLYAAVALTVISGVEYGFRGGRLRREARARRGVVGAGTDVRGGGEEGPDERHRDAKVGADGEAGRRRGGETS